MPLVGIDVGTSFIKGAILDPENASLRHICRASFPAALDGLPATRIEIAPAAVMAAVHQLLQQLFSHTPDIDGLLLCGQMGGVILVDPAGQPLTNYLSWRDQRLCESRSTNEISIFDELRSRITPQHFAELGNELRPGAAVCLLYWLQKKRLLPAQAVPLSLPGFVASQLCRTIPSEHPTLALSGLNLVTGDWHRHVLQVLGLDHLEWPVIAEQAPVGTFKWGGRRIPVVAAVGDHQCALVGTGLEENELSLNISTGSQISRISAELKTGDWQIRPYFDKRYLNTITHLPAGRSLDALVALFTEIPRAQHCDVGNPWEYIIEQARRADDHGMDAQLTFFSGALGEMGSLTGLRLENLTVGHVFRTALRSMARNYQQCADRIDSGRTWTRIVFSGGLASRLDLLKQFVLEKLPGPHRLCVHEEDTLMGLLALATQDDST